MAGSSYVSQNMAVWITMESGDSPLFPTSKLVLHFCMKVFLCLSSYHLVTSVAILCTISKMIKKSKLFFARYGKISMKIYAFMGIL